jgi:hypothetical protein
VLFLLKRNAIATTAKYDKGNEAQNDTGLSTFGEPTPANNLDRTPGAIRDTTKS